MGTLNVFGACSVALCAITGLAALVILLVIVTNGSRLSRVSRMALNVVIVSILNLVMLAFMMFRRFGELIRTNSLRCKLFHIVLQYLTHALPSSVIVLNIYCFIWIRHPDIDARRNFFTAIALVPHVIAFLITVGLLAGSVISLDQGFCRWYFGFNEKPTHEEVLSLCLNVIVPFGVDFIIVCVLISISISLYKKSRMRQGAMRNAMRRRIEILGAVLVLNTFLIFFILPPRSFLFFHYPAAFTMMCWVGHVLMVLWWPVLLPDVRVFLWASIHSVYEQTKRLLLPQHQRPSVESSSVDQANSPSEQFDGTTQEDPPQELQQVVTNGGPTDSHGDTRYHR